MFDKRTLGKWVTSELPDISQTRKCMSQCLASRHKEHSEFFLTWKFMRRQLRYSHEELSNERVRLSEYLIRGRANTASASVLTLYTRFHISATETKLLSQMAARRKKLQILPASGPAGPSALPTLRSGTGLPSTIDTSLRLKSIFNCNLSTGDFFDVKFYAFSRRRHDGVVDKPKAIYANKAILSAGSEYFSHLFTGGFSECIKSDLDGDFPADKKPFNDFYTYNDDSDFEDDQDVDFSSLHRVPGTPTTVDAHFKEISETSSTLNQEDAKSDRIGEGEPTSQNSSIKANSKAPPGRQGLVIVKPDVAFKTLRALIFYLSTGDITFSPLRSAKTSNSPMPFRQIHEPVPCSAKSMYRLACELQLEDLKTQARTHIRNTLTAQNALDEMFSEFTSWHPEVMATEADYIHCSIPRNVVKEKLKSWEDKIVLGDTQHLLPALMALTHRYVQG